MEHMCWRGTHAWIRDVFRSHAIIVFPAVKLGLLDEDFVPLCFELRAKCVTQFSNNFPSMNWPSLILTFPCFDKDSVHETVVNYRRFNIKTQEYL